MSAYLHATEDVPDDLAGNLRLDKAFRRVDKTTEEIEDARLDSLVGLMQSAAEQSTVSNLTAARGVQHSLLIQEARQNLRDVFWTEAEKVVIPHDSLEELEGHRWVGIGDQF